MFGLVGPTDPAFDLQLVRRGIPPKALKRRNHMTKKVAHTKENILGWHKVDGEWVPFWEDNEPWESQVWTENWGKNVTSLTMAGGPRPVVPPKTPKGSGGLT